MKYLKKFESIHMKKYIVATEQSWDGQIFIFKTLKVDDDVFYYSGYFNIDDGGNVKEIISESSYYIEVLDILYQTDDLDDAINMLHTIQKSKKYNL